MVSTLLTVLSALWLALLTLVPDHRGQVFALVLTGTALLANGVTSCAVLFYHKRVPFLLNVLQILLFAMAHFQIFLVFGPDHYTTQRATDLFDWQLFAWSHALSAADLVHVLESFGGRVNPIEAASTLAGTVLVIMHWNVSLFVVSILVRWASRLWMRIVKGTEVKPVPRDRQIERLARWQARLKRWQLRGLVAALLAYALTASLDQWRPSDWLLWPLDNLVRTLDLGNTLGVFDWRLDAVGQTTWIITLGIFFRLLVGSYVARGLHALHVRWLGPCALRLLEDYMEDLTDHDRQVRAAAAEALGEIGAPARPAVSALVHAIDDEDGPVVLSTRHALSKIGAPARALIPELIDLLANPNWAVRRAAADALGRIGPEANAALPCLMACLADKDRTLEKYADTALRRIDRNWTRNALVREGMPALVRRLEDRERRLRQRAADVLGWVGQAAQAAIPDLLLRLKDRDEYVRLSAAKSLDQIDPSWRYQVHVTS